MDRPGQPVIRLLPLLALLWAIVCAPAQATAPMNGQAGVTTGLYGRPTAQPYFDFPNWARFSNCRPGPLPWGYEVFPDYGPCDWACNGAPSVGCPGGFVAHRPRDWYVTADFAPLTIDYTDDIEIGRLGPLGPTLLTTSDLDFDYNAGGEITVGRRIWDCYRLEASYLGVYRFTDAAAITNADVNTQGGTGNISTLLSQFNNPIVPGLDENNFVFISNVNEMETAELNLRYWIDMPPGPFDVSLSVGARFMRLDDQFNFISTANVPVATVNAVQVTTENELWGIQLGIAGDWLVHPRYWVNTEVKGVMFDNTASQVTSYAVTAGGVPALFPTAAAQSRTTWMIDLSVVGCWQMTPTLTLRAGYQAMFIDGLAVGFENLQTDNLILQNGPGLLDDSGQVIYHGPILGLTWMR